MTFETLTNRALIQYSVRTKSDLHIGGHATTAPGEVDLPVLKNPDGFPVIPGSSLKGVLRTELERLMKGAGIRDVCSFPRVCGKPEKGVQQKSHNVGKDDTYSCPICQLFGGMNLAGSVRIHDATSSSRKTGIRDHVGIDRRTRKGVTSAKFDIETVPMGSFFSGSIVIENLDLMSEDGQKSFESAKLGGFISLVNFFNVCSGRIGGAGSRGYGQVELIIEEIRILTADDYLKGNFNGTCYSLNDTDGQKLKEYSIAASDAWQGYLNTLSRRTGDQHDRI